MKKTRYLKNLTLYKFFKKKKYLIIFIKLKKHNILFNEKLMFSKNKIMNGDKLYFKVFMQ